MNEEKLKNVIEYLKLNSLKQNLLKEQHPIEFKLYDVKQHLKLKPRDEDAYKIMCKYREQFYKIENEIKEIEKKLKNKKFKDVDILKVNLDEFTLKLIEQNEKLEKELEDKNKIIESLVSGIVDLNHKLENVNNARRI